MESDPGAKVTPEEIIGSILDEMRQSIVPAWYTDFVPNVFRVYSFREDLELMRALERPIREQAVRALDEALEELNKPTQHLFRNKPHAQRCEQLGPWSIEFLENSDDDAAANRLIVSCIPPVPPAADMLEGAGTVRVNPEPNPSEDHDKTSRTPFAAPPPSSVAPHARLSYVGLTLQEMSHTMGGALSTLHRDLKFAQAWIVREIASEAPSLLP